MYLNCRRRFKQLCRTKKHLHNKEQAQLLLANSVKPNSKDFWQQLKSLIHSKPSSPITISPRQWQHYFDKLLNPHPSNADFQDTDNEQYVQTSSQDETDLNTPITEDEVREAIQKLKTGKACGPDGIPPDLYMCQAPIFVEYLVTLFNTVFHSGIYPDEWTKSMIFPLYKKGNANDVNNYRGISLLNVLGKIFSHVLNARLKRWCDMFNVIPEAQAGFRSNYSTIDNIFTLQSLVQKYIGQAGGRFYVLYVDFFKAFDWVDRAKLWYIMQENGCNNNMLAILKSMYASVMASVRILHASQSDSSGIRMNDGMPGGLSDGMYLTEYFNCMSGVKQGCKISPILFSIFISQFEKEMTANDIRGVQLLANDVHANSLMYADDLALFADNVLDMQRKINALEEFCDKWKLKINTDKSKMMVFRNGGYLKQSEKWWFKGEILSVASYYSYLGVVFSSRLCWSKFIDNQVCKGLRIISRLRHVFNKLDGVDIKTAAKIFDMKIKPLLMYGSEIWGTKQYDTVENVQTRFFKAFLGIGKTTENRFILSEVGRHSVCIDTKCRAVKYWCKLLYLDYSRFPRKCYIQQYRHAEMGRKNWAAEIKQILFCSGFGYAWVNQEISNVKLFLHMFKDRLCAINLQEMRSEISEKYELYLEYHPTLEIADYILGMKSLCQRRVISLLRTRSLPLNNNLYRSNLSKSSICTRCSLSSTDDEFHFLLQCVSLDKERKAHLPAYFINNPTMVKFAKLLSTHNETILRNIVCYIRKCLLSRLDIPKTHTIH